jgi:2-methylisocitrate lyase-like PEP mutase family enzyme
VTAGRPRRELLCRPPDLDDTIARLKAYANAGADCLYAPGIKTREQIAAVVAARAASRSTCWSARPAS